ncbi:unnamed protein product [Arctogadus glacialis]
MTRLSNDFFRPEMNNILHSIMLTKSGLYFTVFLLTLQASQTKALPLISNLHYSSQASTSPLKPPPLISNLSLPSPTSTSQ